MAKGKYALELRPGLNAAQFNAGGEEVELTKESPVFETDDPAVFAGVRGLPFLKVKGEKEPSS